MLSGKILWEWPTFRSYHLNSVSSLFKNDVKDSFSFHLFPHPCSTFINFRDKNLPEAEEDLYFYHFLSFEYPVTVNYTNKII